MTASGSTPNALNAIWPESANSQLMIPAPGLDDLVLPVLVVEQREGPSVASA
jgi:hypothetical protein